MFLQPMMFLLKLTHCKNIKVQPGTSSSPRNFFPSNVNCLLYSNMKSSENYHLRIDSHCLCCTDNMSFLSCLTCTCCHINYNPNSFDRNCNIRCNLYITGWTAAIHKVCRSGVHEMKKILKSKSNFT